MQILENIIQEINVLGVRGSLNKHVSELTVDSRKAKSDTAFFAIKGNTVDGHDFIPQVIQSECKIIFASNLIAVPEDVTLIITDNTSLALALVANKFYGEPSQKIKLIGVTGTNGKTTTATLLYKLYSSMGYRCGLVSTVINRIGDNTIPSTHTTPDPVRLNELLAKMVIEECTHCFMEVSSHAIHQHRISGLKFTGGVFTNITHDHLDYHKTFAEYIRVKKSFFDQLNSDAFALTNCDDKNGLVMLQNTKARKSTYALKSPADFKAKVIENVFSGLVININGKELWSRLIGDFNAYNLLAVFAVSQLLGENATEVLTVLSNTESVEGRFQHFQSRIGITAIIDYAHTPDALENVLKTINNIRAAGHKVITVVGCGGDRDREKRPKIAAIACELSNNVIFTSDNPRSEDPTGILQEMINGVTSNHFKKTLTIVDREQAIKTAITMADKGDIILIAGKGHEKYQEIKGIKYDFDDLQKTIDLFTKLEK